MLTGTFEFPHRRFDKLTTRNVHGRPIDDAGLARLEFRDIKWDGLHIRATDFLQSPHPDTRAIPRPGA